MAERSETYCGRRLGDSPGDFVLLNRSDETLRADVDTDLGLWPLKNLPYDWYDRSAPDFAGITQGSHWCMAFTLNRPS